MNNAISGTIYLLHKFILTKTISEYDDFDTKGFFILCAGDLSKNSVDLFVQTAKSYWLKWPVNIEECKILLSVYDDNVIYFDKPEISVDSKGRYCFDAVNFLNKLGLGFVSKNQYSPQARVKCSSETATVCAGGLWFYRGNKDSNGKLKMYFSAGNCILDNELVYNMIISLKYNPFKSNQACQDYITNFIEKSKNIVLDELIFFLKKLPVCSVEINTDKHSKKLIAKEEQIFVSENENYFLSKVNMEDMTAYNLSQLLTLEYDKGILLLLSGNEDNRIPARIIICHNKKEFEIQFLVNPTEDYLLYKNLVTGLVIKQKICEFGVINNLLKIDITKWLDDNQIKYYIRPISFNKYVFGKDYYFAMSDLIICDNWSQFLEEQLYFTIKDKFERFVFIYLSMKEPLYGTINAVYIGHSFESAIDKMLEEFQIDDDIDEKLTEKLLYIGKEFSYYGRFGNGNGYIKKINSYEELLYWSDKMGIKESVQKEYHISKIDTVLSEFFKEIQ